MDVQSLIIFPVIGAMAGWLTGQIMKGLSSDLPFMAWRLFQAVPAKFSAGSGSDPTRSAACPPGLP